MFSTLRCISLLSSSLTRYLRPFDLHKRPLISSSPARSYFCCSNSKIIREQSESWIVSPVHFLSSSRSTRSFSSHRHRAANLNFGGGGERKSSDQTYKGKRKRGEMSGKNSNSAQCSSFLDYPIQYRAECLQAFIQMEKDLSVHRPAWNDHHCVFT